MTAIAAVLATRLVAESVELLRDHLSRLAIVEQWAWRDGLYRSVLTLLAGSWVALALFKLARRWI